MSLPEGQVLHGEQDKGVCEQADNRGLKENCMAGASASCLGFNNQNWHKNQLLGLLSYWFPGKCSLCLISPSSILNQISFAEQERTRNPGSEKDFDPHVIIYVLCNFWWVQINSEKFSARKDLRGNLAQPTFCPMLLMWRLRPRERRWPAHDE